MEQQLRTQGSFADIMKEKNHSISRKWFIFSALAVAIVIILGLSMALPFFHSQKTVGKYSVYITGAPVDVNDFPQYEGNPYVVINDNRPALEAEHTLQSFEWYSDLDELGRCGPAYASISKELMPTDSREPISEIIPSGWNNQMYSEIDQDYLYNRCHLIGFQLTGENANEKNLITGTRYMNTIGMLPFENSVREYVERTGNHVLYRVTPVFDESDLVASGVVMEAWSVEDSGKGICFYVYVYNVQPGITIDYSNGKSYRNEE